jgi:hypothetical protein
MVKDGEKEKLVVTVTKMIMVTEPKAEACDKAQEGVEKEAPVVEPKTE